MVAFLLKNCKQAVLMLLVATLLPSGTVHSEEIEEHTLLENRVIIDCQYESIDTVLIDISEQSGLKITYDKRLEKTPVRFAFNDKIKAIEAIVRLLRGKNNVIEFSSDRKNLNIRMFDI